MKKIIAFLLAATMVFALGTSVMANPHGDRQAGPNKSPGVHVDVLEYFTVNIFGNGNSLNLRVTNATNEEIARVNRPANNRYTEIALTGDYCGFVLGVFVRGNSILRVSLLGSPVVEDEPYVVDTYSFYQFVRLNQIESIFEGTSEVSREFVDGAAVMYNWVRGNQNDFPGLGFTGQAVQTGARVTGILNYEYVRDYLQQFEQIYEWVDVTVWSNGDRFEVVREDSEHVRDVVDGDEYYTGPYAGSSLIDVNGGEVILHMGYQGGVFGRYATIIVGGFTVDLELRDTGNPPTITVTITSVDLAAL